MSLDVIDDSGVETIERPEPYGDLAVLHSSLAEFCAADVPVARALQSLDEELRNGSLRDECATMARDIERGTPFAEAYGRCSASFPRVYCALVEAGVASGDVAGVLREISVDASLRARIRDQLRRKLEYPMIAAGCVLVIGIAIALAVPGTLQITGDVSRLWHGEPTLTESTTWMFGWSGVGLLALLAVGCVVIASLRKPLDPGAGPRGLRYRLPFLGLLRSHAAKAGFASTMALLLRRRMPLPHALELCAAGVEQGEVREQIERMADRARRGDDLGESLRAGELIPPHLLWFVEAAGSSDASTRALDDIASIYRNRLQRATDRVATFAVPIIELLIGLVVLLFALDYVQPAYRLMNGVFGG